MMRNKNIVFLLVSGIFFLPSCDKNDESCGSDIGAKILKLWTLKTTDYQFEHIGNYYSEEDSLLNINKWSETRKFENGLSRYIELYDYSNDTGTTYLSIDTLELNFGEQVLFEDNGKFLWYRMYQKTYESHTDLDTFYSVRINGSINNSESDGYYNLVGNRMDIQSAGPLNGMYDISIYGDNLIIERHTNYTGRTDYGSTYSITTETTNIKYIFQEE